VLFILIQARGFELFDAKPRKTFSGYALSSYGFPPLPEPVVDVVVAGTPVVVVVVAAGLLGEAGAPDGCGVTLMPPCLAGALVFVGVTGCGGGRRLSGAVTGTALSGSVPWFAMT
jgi:hypothetical protein